ncbi:uncharacterized protein LOC114934061 [Nylanderia fulva]|uniref:uncharacterized protein LOC114934061 n=1 Tax=Nylanderia fulva TaxID=613905 RepID=UPI0010FAFCC6|nr:uncharacterized protein LOC114934061 [Nylanderia fulva]
MRRYTLWTYFGATSSRALVDVLTHSLLFYAMASADPNLSFDRVSAFAPALLILVMCLTIFHRLKVRWPVMVNCWFCNESSKVWRQHLNWLLCPWCEQYNGFSKNGDYTYDIPEQYAASKVSPRYCRLEQRDSRNAISKGHLCADCNKRESLKLLELSNFEPKSERRYNAELKNFKDYLEKRYSLCENCKLTVQNVLSKQALWLTRYKMSFFRQRPIRLLISNARRSEAVFRVISKLLILAIGCNQDLVWLPIAGLFFHLCACWTSLRKRKRTDVLLMLLWLFTIILVSVKDFTLQNVWFTAEHIVQYRMITMCAVIMGFLSMKPTSYKNTINSVAFKKIKPRSQPVATPLLRNDSESKNNISNGILNVEPSSIFATGEVPFTEVKSHSAMLRQKLSTITRDNDNHLNFVSQNNSPDGCGLNHSLSTLFLNEDSPRYGKSTARVAPAIFERKVYSATNSENLFRRSSSTRRYVLSPPKLRSVTQTSWVAGGYWQEGHAMTSTPPTLSRSSSQSSGFGSAGSSNFAPSREPSVHELDRCSVVSDATRWSYHAPRGNHASSPSRMTGEEQEMNPGSRSELTPTFQGHHTTTTIVASSGWLSALLCGSLILNMIVLCATLLR